MVSRHTHTCTLVRLHSNLIWKSDGIRGVYVDVCVCTWGHFSLLTSCFFCASVYLYDLHACVKRLRRPAAISVKVQRYEIENENSKKEKQRKR